MVVVRNLINNPMALRLIGAGFNFCSIALLTYISSEEQSFLFLAFASANFFGVIIRMGQGNSILADSGAEYCGVNEKKVNISYSKAIQRTFIIWSIILILVLSFCDRNTVIGVLASFPMAVLNLTASLERAKRNSTGFAFYGFVIQPLSWLTFLLAYFIVKSFFELNFDYVLVWIVSLWFSVFFVLKKNALIKILFSLEGASNKFYIAFFRQLKPFIYGVIPFFVVYFSSWIVFKVYDDSLHNVYEISYRLFSLVIFPLYSRLYSIKSLDSTTIIEANKFSRLSGLFVFFILIFCIILNLKLLLVVSLSLCLALIIYFFSVFKDHYFVNVINQKEMWRSLTFTIVPFFIFQIYISIGLM